MEILLKRIYEEKKASDGFRILVDRLYPRGIKKESLHIDLWAKEIAPTDILRKAYHTTGDYQYLEEHYTEELSQNPIFVLFLEQIKDKEKITLLTASKDVNHSQLPILKAFIENSIVQK